MKVRDRIKASAGMALLYNLRVLRALCSALGLNRSYRSILVYLIKRTQLFDRDFYLDANSDVASAGMPPLRHYVSYGDYEGRAPGALFEPVYYREQARLKARHVNALLHYAFVGRFFGYSTSPWFDVGHYLANNKDLAKKGLDPLLHYLTSGGLEGRSPSPQFDGARYLQAYRDVAEMRMNPLIHFLRRGRFEGRQASFSDVMGEPSVHDVTPVPDEQSWGNLQPRGNVVEASIDVVIPVYKGHAETLRCLYSVLSAPVAVTFEVIVIIDASPEEGLVRQLKAISERGLFRLIENEQNLGFVRTANLGMSLNPNRDIVLLNSDTEVYGDWLDRLTAAAARTAKTATVTPLSNNATICSYPYSLQDNPFPLELGYAELDTLASKANADLSIEAPTGVGFCLYIAREAIRDVGMFDEKAFGKGYGEENDFCLRAIAKGWRNVIAANIFVRHWGGASFQGEKAARVTSALKEIDRRYPQYRQEITEFIKRDPLREARRRLDWARMRHASAQKNILIVCHSRGGGSERHVREDIQRLVKNKCAVYIMRPVVGRPTHVVIRHNAIHASPNTGEHLLENTDALAEVLREIRIDEIHTHGLVDFAPEAPQQLMALAKAIGARVEVNLHDYKVICPRINLADDDGRYCGEPDDEGCNRCLAQRGSGFDVFDIGTWRQMHGQALLEADRVIAPDHDVAQRLSRYFPRVYCEVSPHEDVHKFIRQPDVPILGACEPLRIVVIGAIGKLKGFDVLLKCADYCRRKRLPLNFILMGYSMNDRVLAKASVRIAGKYLDTKAAEVLRGLDPHVVWLPSICPETYSYTLSIALESALPVVAFDIGAIAARLRHLGHDQHLMPLALESKPQCIAEAFVQFRDASIRKVGCFETQPAISH